VSGAARANDIAGAA
jgi:hypothetical protein